MNIGSWANVRLQLLVALAAAAIPALAKPQLLAPYDKPTVLRNAPNVRSQGHAVQFNRGEMASLKAGTEVELSLPDATRHPFVLDLVERQPDGIVNWIGHHRDRGTDYRVVITSGPAGTFGRLSTPEREYRLVPGPGHDWLLDMTAEAADLPKIDLRRDTLTIPVAPKSKLLRSVEQAAPEYRMAIPGINSVAKTHTAQATVDLMVAHTPNFRAHYGSAAAMNTRLANLVATANTAYADSGVGIFLRLVHTVEVPWAETDSLTALCAITPVDCDGAQTAFGLGGTGVFSSIESLRAQYGADLVAFLQDGSDFGGDGIAWKPPHPLTVLNDEDYMYSVTTGCMSYCENVFIHELGHNMGNAHDRATAAWQDGGVPNPQTGSYSYSFGYYFCNGGISAAALSCNPFVPPGTLASGGNPAGCAANQQPECAGYVTNQFADLMAYFHGTTWTNYKFSNPAVSCAGENGVLAPCGIGDSLANSANTALSMNNNRDVLSSMRASAGVATTTSLASSVNPSVTGQSVTFTANVAGAGGPPTGTVVFRANGSTISGCGARLLSAGVATCATSVLAAGGHSITAQYLGAGSFSGSTSNTVLQTVHAMGDSNVIDERGNIDFNNDGMGDLSWKHTNGGQGIWLMNQLTYSQYAALSGGTGALIRLFGDFNGDGKSDILWRRPDGSYHVALMDGIVAAPLVQVLGAGSGWEVVGKADLNADGKSDLLWKHATNGSYGAWLMDGVAYTATGSLEGAFSGWQLLKSADFDGDGKDDLIWMHSDGRVRLQIMEDLAIESTTQLLAAGNAWLPIRLADFNNDGKADIVLRRSNGQHGIWQMDGATMTAYSSLVPAGSGWEVATIGDLDADGKDDIVWSHTDGRQAGWLMNGVTPSLTAVMYPAGTGWSVAGNDDYNGDGKADLIWRHTNGSYGIWLMDGLGYTSYAAMYPGGTGWNISP